MQGYTISSRKSESEISREMMGIAAKIAFVALVVTLIAFAFNIISFFDVAALVLFTFSMAYAILVFAMYGMFVGGNKII